MSEFMNIRENRVRWQLLATVSAFALIGSVTVQAADADRPQIWIELGGQLSRLDDGQEVFAPPLMAARPSIFAPSQKFERPPLYAIDEFGGISFQPDSSDWVLSASIRYGRSANKRNVRQQNALTPFVKYYYTSFPTVASGHISRHKQKNVDTPKAAKFADTGAQTSERHAILDFQAGKDVGLGMFGGKDGSSVLSVGVRFAQFRSRSDIALKSDPDWHFHYKYMPSIISPNRPSSKFAFGEVYHSNQASLRATRSFHGVGPSISWNASAPFAGNPQDSELTFDWGLNAALLFGRQRAKVHHQTTARYHGNKYNAGQRVTVGTPVNVDHTRSRSVTVPNVGGFAGLSFRYADAKLSLGYRADFFFGAMDGGIDAAKKENRGFFGPFASISIGLGD